MRVYHILTLGVLVSATAVSSHAESLPADSVKASPLGEVVVTGTNRSVPERLLPYTVSVIGPDELEATGDKQILSAVSGMVPSLFVTQRSVFGFGVSNGGAGHIKLRGVGGDRASAILMMVDGQPQFAGIYSHSIGDFYSKENVERVEVLRGPGSVLYGSNAMAGAINVITKQPKKDGVYTTLSSEFGSYDTWLSTLTNTTRFGKFSSFVSLEYNRTDGNVKNFDFKQANGYGRVGYDFSNIWKGYVDYTLMNFHGSDPIYPRLSDPESTVIYHQSITRGEASATVTNDYGRTSGSARIYYNYGNHYIDDPRHFHSTDNRIGIILYQNFHPWQGAAATVGFDFDRYSGHIPMSGGNVHKPGSMSTMDSKHIVEYSPYITLSQMFMSDLLNFNAGLRMANSDKFDTQWIPQFGFAINPSNGWNMKGNLAMGYRNPSFRELYLYRMANPDLSPEKMMNYEVSVGKSFGALLSGDVTLYYSKGDNMIQTVDMKNQNTGSFINKGVEVALRSHPLSNLSLSASYSYLHTSLDDLTGAPRHQYFFGAEWKPWKFLNIAADVKGVDKLFTGTGTDTRSFALLDMKVTWEIIRQLSVFVRAENLTDARYEIVRGYTMPGITVFGGFTLRI